MINYVGHSHDADGSVSEVQLDYFLDTIGQNAPEGIKCKAVIHWGVFLSEGFLHVVATLCRC